MLLALVLGCGAPAADLALPAAPPAENATALPVARLLAPTPSGAEGDILCPWARGEIVPDASLARWLAEDRLAWRVLLVDAGGATYAGRPDVREGAAEQADAIRALAARCGTEPAMEALVAVRPDAPYGHLVEAFMGAVQGGIEPAWLLVEDTTPGPVVAPRAPPAARPSAPAEMPASGSTLVAASLAALLGGGEPPVQAMVHVGADAATVIASDGQPIAGPLLDVLSSLATSGTTCAVVAGRRDVAWEAVARTVDRLQGVGMETLLAANIDDTGPDAPPPVLQRPGRRAGLRAELAVLPIVVPRYCAGADHRCGCGAAAVVDSPGP